MVDTRKVGFDLLARVGELDSQFTLEGQGEHHR